MKMGLIIRSERNEIAHLKELSERFETFNKINMYTTILLTPLGCIINILSVLILIYSRHKKPRIFGSKYLIVITLTNTVYLLTSFFNGTYYQIIYFFKLDYNYYSTSFPFFNSNTHVCKTLPYLKLCAKMLNTLLVVCFSLERFIAVYFPFKARTMNSTISVSFTISILISFVIPAFVLFTNDLRSNKGGENLIYNVYNLSRSFNYYSTIPAIGSQSCTAYGKKYQTHLFFSFVFILIVFLSYFFVSFSLFAIIAKLKRRQKNLRLSYRVNKPSSHSFSLLSHRQQKRRESNASNNEVFESVASHQENCCVFDPINRMHSSINSRRSDVMHPIRRLQSTGRLNNYKGQDTRVLCSLSISFFLLNTPYYVIMLIFIAYEMIVEYDHSIDDFSISDLVFQLKKQQCIIISETLQVLNFSLIGLVFFLSGHLFRAHFFGFFKAIFSKPRFYL